MEAAHPGAKIRRVREGRSISELRESPLWARPLVVCVPRMLVGFSGSRMAHPARRTEDRAHRRRAPPRRTPTAPSRRRSAPPEASSRPCAPTGGVSTAPCRSTAPQYCWPRSQREQMNTWRRHRAHRNSRASSIAAPGGEGWTIRDQRAILRSEPYASADLGAASDVTAKSVQSEAASRSSRQPDPTHGRWTIEAPRIGSYVAIGESRRRAPPNDAIAHGTSA